MKGKKYQLILALNTGDLSHGCQKLKQTHWLQQSRLSDLGPAGAALCSAGAGSPCTFSSSQHLCCSPRDRKQMLRWKQKGHWLLLLGLALKCVQCVTLNPQLLHLPTSHQCTAHDRKEGFCLEPTKHLTLQEQHRLILLLFFERGSCLLSKVLRGNIRLLLLDTVFIITSQTQFIKQFFSISKLLLVQGKILKGSSAYNHYEICGSFSEI